MTSVNNKSEITISFVDVGHGDCTIIVDQKHKDALVIDCPLGGVNAASSVLGDASINAVIVTHLDADHYGGIVKLLSKSGGCRALWMAPVVSLGKRDYIKVRAFAREVASVLRSNTAGEWVSAGFKGKHGQAKWTCLTPTLVQGVEALFTTNNRASIVVLVEVGDLRVLVGSDADGIVWQDLISSGVNIRANILRYPHHGAPLPGGKKSASLSKLLEAVQPSHVVLSIGEMRRYGHPRAEVIETLVKGGVTIMCTRSTALCNGGHRSNQSCAGTVTIRCGSDDWNVSPGRSAHNRAINLLPTPACRAGATLKSNTQE